jgi:murein DD-endopeptidase MepM/ murein hydrolase activator NlpD
MAKKLLIIVLIVMDLLALEHEHLWEKGMSFVTFLEKSALPEAVYYDLEAEDREILSEIKAGVTYRVVEENNRTKEITIPVSRELYARFTLDQNGTYRFTTVPIEYEESYHALSIEIETSPYVDIIQQSGSKELADAFSVSFSSSIDFRRDLRKGDALVILYTKRQQVDGKMSEHIIDSAMLESRGKEHHIYRFSDGRYYNAKGKMLEKINYMRVPVKYSRISSKFTHKRWHPVLKRYRAHLGIDYAAKTGTPVRAAYDGKIIYRARKGGYGKSVEIAHRGGYKTLYAHLSKYRKGKRRGTRVKKGEVIGYVGSTGMSTGPHLHFGLYENGRAINPNRMIRIVKKLGRGDRKKFFETVAEYDDRIGAVRSQEATQIRYTSREYNEIQNL